MDKSIAIYALLALTGVIHLFVGLGDLNANLLLFLNGVGYFGLMILYFIAHYRGYGGIYHLYIILLYTLITLIGYFVIWLPESGLALFTSQPLGMFTKLVELVLVVLVIQELQQS